MKTKMTDEQRLLIRLARRLNLTARFAAKHGVVLPTVELIADDLAIRAGYAVVSQQ